MSDFVIRLNIDIPTYTLILYWIYYAWVIADIATNIKYIAHHNIMYYKLKLWAEKGRIK
jgi:hypothetical protein